MATLVLTNGDSAAYTLAEAGKEARIVSWQDVLHDGPIVGGALEQVTPVRVDWLAARYRIDLAEVAAGFAARDAVLRAHGDYDRVELWFEHDLYDQLQLVQILDFFAGVGRSEGVILVQADEFLGTQAAATILRFEALARPIDEEDLDLAEVTWADLAMPTPERIAAFVAEPDMRLPFLAPALRRFLEELPAPGNGLSRSEAAALGAIGAGATRAGEVFRRVIEQEEAAFMGDSTLYAALDDLAFAAVPLVAGLAPPPPQEDDSSRHLAAAFTLTDAGRAVLAGAGDHVALNGLDRWWGGTRLLGRSVWRYDRDAFALVPPEAPGA